MARNQYYIRQTRRNICEACETVFYSNKSTAAYCSNKCKQVAYRKRKEEVEAARQMQPKLL